MKKQSLTILTAITVLFSVFTLGFFLGRSQNSESIHLSTLPVAPRHDLATIPPSVPEETRTQIQFPVDLNSAQISELTALPGIGETLANRILNYREVNGAFSSPEELLNVEGIGSGKLEAILDYVITGG